MPEAAKEKLARERRKVFPKVSLQVDPAEGPIGKRFFDVLDLTWQGVKNLATGRIIPFGPERFRPKESERGKEARYLKEIGSKFIPGTKIPNPKYNPRELYLYNLRRDLTYDDPVTPADIENLKSYKPGLFFSKGGRAGYTGGGLANLTRTVAPDSGPMSQGLRSLYINDRDY